MQTIVQTVLRGRIDPSFTADGRASAIAKTVVDGPRTVTLFGIEGDEQADPDNHGGRDKALHHYPRDHYAGWQHELGQIAALDEPGAFGENISTSGWTEQSLCIGDRLRLGSALVEVAQGRAPCWKQGHRLGAPKVVTAMAKSGRCGWYYRVIEEGSVAAGDAIVLVSRIHREWTVARASHLLIGGGHRDGRSGGRDALIELSRMEVLADEWRTRAARLAG